MSDELQNAATIASLRASLEAAAEREESLQAQMKYVRQDLATARERAGVLEREVRASRAVKGTDRHPAWVELAEAIAETDRLNAIDAAKFGGA